MDIGELFKMDMSSTVLAFMASVLLTSTSFAERVTMIHAKAPNKPVEEGSILALHCEVYNFKANEQEVSILRITNGKTERLAMGNNVMPNIDERVFLATRQLDAGSTVYFLTIIQAKRADEGEYLCKVIKEGKSTEEISISSLHMDIQFFPDESNPECDQPKSLEITTGQSVFLRCSSANGKPNVAIKWVVENTVIPNNQTEIDGKQVSFIKVIPKNKSIYLCKVTSVVFPGKEASCHVGPFRITPNQSVSSTADTNDDISHIPEIVPIVNKPVDTIDKPLTEPPVSKQACKNECELLNSRSFYWILATIIISILAVLFLIICIVLLCKYHQQTDRTYERGRCISTRPHLQGIYSELDFKRCENKEYMVLSKNTLIARPDLPQIGTQKIGL